MRAWRASARPEEGRGIQCNYLHGRNFRRGRCGSKSRSAKRLAKKAVARPFSPLSSVEVSAICEGIAKDIRHQYSIGYVSANTQPGGHRAIRVVARSAGKDLVVRTREGYIAA